MEVDGLGLGHGLDGRRGTMPPEGRNSKRMRAE